MIYTEILDLIDEIKKEESYIQFIEAEKTLNSNPDLKELLNQFYELSGRKEKLERYGSYISTEELDREIKDTRMKLFAFQESIDYLEALKALNEVLDEVSMIVFNNISEELMIGRFGKFYARHRR
jgi:cell fate (sporulation/competence/biofilm development) regulator YlbF (YheA/YmcA/DUF963 family)